MKKISQIEKCQTCMATAQVMGEAYKNASEPFRREKVREGVESIARKWGCVYKCDLKRDVEDEK